MIASAVPSARPRRRWIWVLVALATTIVVVVPATLRLGLKADLQHQSDPLVSYRRAIRDLQVQSDAGGAITIMAGRPGRVTVSSTLSWLVRKPAITQSWQGLVFRVGAMCPKFNPFEDCGATVIISVPPGTAVLGQAGAGSLTVVGLSGPLHLTATSGLVAAKNVSGPVTATATSGSVVARDGLRSPTVHASVTTGLISLVFSVRPRSAAFSVAAGSAMITVPSGSRYRVVSSGGPGILSLAPGLSDPASHLVLTATVGTGAAHVGYPPGTP